MLPLEQLSHRLSRTWSPISHLNGVLNSDELRASYNACLPLLSNYWTDLAQSEPLFRAYSAIAANEADRLDAAQRRVIERALEDFRLAGVGLPAERKARYKAVVQELAQLGAKFEENVLDAMNAWTRLVTDETRARRHQPGASSSRRACAPPRKASPGWLFALEQPTYVAVMTDADSEALRRDFYEAWSTRASDRGPNAGKFDNTAVMAKILALRHEAARLLDFPNYAAYALATRMAPSNQAVFDFLRELVRVARPAAQSGVRRAREVRRPQAERLGRRLLRREAAGQAVLHLAGRAAPLLPAAARARRPVRGRGEAVRREDRRAPGRARCITPTRASSRSSMPSGKARAGFYLDACARPKKRAGAWMDDCVGRKDFGAEHTVPVAYLVCNFLPAAPGQARAAHARRRRDHVPRVRPRPASHADARGLPEHRRHQRRVLGCGRAAEPVPRELRVAPRGARDHGAALRNRRAAARRTADAVAGLAHLPRRARDDAPARVRAVRFPPARRIRPGARRAHRRDPRARCAPRSAVFAVPEWNRFPHNFGHIFAGGYAAGYYSYKWAEVLAADAFAAFEEQGVFDRKVAQRFLDAILSAGGSRKALDAFVEFRGRPPDVNALLRQQGLVQ